MLHGTYFSTSLVMFSFHHVADYTDLWPFAAALSCWLVSPFGCASKELQHWTHMDILDVLRALACWSTSLLRTIKRAADVSPTDCMRLSPEVEHTQ